MAAEAIDKHWRVIFNGDGYSEEWPIEAEKRGVWRIDSGVDAIQELKSSKNVALFDRMKVGPPPPSPDFTTPLYISTTPLLCMPNANPQHEPHKTTSMQP